MTISKKQIYIWVAIAALVLLVVAVAMYFTTGSAGASGGVAAAAAAAAAEAYRRRKASSETVEKAKLDSVKTKSEISSTHDNAVSDMKHEEDKVAAMTDEEKLAEGKRLLGGGDS